MKDQPKVGQAVVYTDWEGCRTLFRVIKAVKPEPNWQILVEAEDSSTYTLDYFQDIQPPAGCKGRLL